jgi:uncharacterized protein YggE
MRAITALLLTASLALPLPALADDNLPPMITVTGTGTVEAAPDIATLSIGVTTQGETAAEALSANSAALDAVMSDGCRDRSTRHADVEPVAEPELDGLRKLLRQRADHRGLCGVKHPDDPLASA